MAVSEQTPYKEYTANGSANSFALEFDCENQDHLIVLVDDVEPVVGTWSLIGGAVVFSTVPANGKKITIQRNTPFRRDGDFQSYDNSFRPASVNKGFDKIWWKIQELGVADWLLGLKLQKFRDDVNLTALENTLEEAKQIRDETADSVTEVQSNVEQSQTLLENTTTQSNLAQSYAGNANTSKDQAQQAVVDANAIKGDMYTALYSFQNGAIKAYPTLALANADIANIALDTKVSVLSETEGGDYYKATAGATSLTKSPYDPYVQGKIFAKKIAQESIGIAITGDMTLTADQVEYKNITFIGTLTADATITLPVLTGNWVFRNLTTGGFKVLVKCDQQTTETISLFNAEPIPCYAAGRNLFAVSAIVAKRHLNISLTGKTEVTLSADDIKHDTIFFGGTQTADLTVYFPKIISKNIVRHQAAGGFNILLKVQDGSNQSLIKNGEMIEVYSDAISLFQVDNRKAPLESPVFTGVPIAPTPSVTNTTAISNVSFVNKKTGGASFISITGDKTLTLEESSVKTIAFTGTLTADATITVLDATGSWNISNRTTGGFKLFFKVKDQSATPLSFTDNKYYAVLATGSTAHLVQTLNDTKTDTISLTGLISKTLSVEESRNNMLFFGGTLTQDTVINFPKIKGVWNVRHQAAGGFKLLLKVLDSVEPTIEITNQQTIIVVGDQINLFLMNKQNQTGEHRGEFKDRATYIMNDIVEHGSGTYKVISAISQNAVNPMTSQSYKKIGCRPINNKTISVVSESAKAIDGVNVRRVRGISKDGTTFFSNQPYAQITESKDFGKTWTKLFDIPQAEAGLIEQLDDGELIIFVTESAPNTTNLVRRIYKTVGYGTDNPQLVSTKMQQRDKVYFGGQWGFDAYKNIVLACEYGAKYVPTNTSPTDVDVEGGNARYVYLSTDFGKTWKTIFDVNAVTSGVGVHIHSAVFDLYWNRIWVHHGDGSFNRNGMYYSDDFGETWTYALQTNNSGANFPQSTCTVVLPDCILFGSDSMPNGVLRLDRSQGKQPYKGYYTLETAWKHPETSDTLLNAVCYKVAHAKHIPDTPYIFAFAPENLPTKGVLVATYDGYTFFQLWQDSTMRGVGYGPRHVVGVTLQNEVIAQVQDDRFGAGVHTELRLKI